MSEPRMGRKRRPKETPDDAAVAGRPADAPVLADRGDRVVPDLPGRAEPVTRLGSYGNASIDQHDALFLAAVAAVGQKKGVRVNPRFMKAVMGLESGENGNYPVGKCRDWDGHPGPRSCGPMQIKYPYHKDRCPGCDNTTLAGHIELATHIIGDTMLKHDCDEYEAYIRGYLTSDDINGTSQQEAVAALKQRVAKMRADGEGGDTPGRPSLDPWRPYPYPKMVDLVVPKPYDGAGFDRVAFRRPQIEGFATHITDGPDNQTIEQIAAYFATGGGRQYDALTDLVIGKDGRIGLLNDWRDPKHDRGGTRAGWANGWGREGAGFERGGQEWYRRFPHLNVSLVSCEHISRAGSRWSDPQIAASIEIRTAIAQELKIPAASYPINPKHGMSIERQHRDFAQKSCPAEQYISVHEPVILREVQRKLDAWQGGVTPDFPAPEPAVTFTDLGMKQSQVETLFGTMRRYNDDGTVTDLKFNPEGALSLFWLARCEKERKFPESESIMTFDSAVFPGKELWAQWEGGWIAVMPVGDTRASWVWLDEVERP